MRLLLSSKTNFQRPNFISWCCQRKTSAQFLRYVTYKLSSLCQKSNSIKYSQLNKSHISLLDDMYLMARQLIWKKEMSKDSFKIGFHALPSKQQLHLHVISKDFDSDCLRTVTNWNGFNTDYFIPLHGKTFRGL